MAQVTGLFQGPRAPTSAWQQWPGAHLPTSAHPPGTRYTGVNNVPQYPLDATCRDLGEQDPYFPVTWHLLALALTAFLLYIVWPLYVLRHLVRKKSIYGGDDLFQTNHDKYKAKLDELAAQRKGEMSEE